MKKLVVAIAVGMVAVGAFAQGKVALANNSAHLVYFSESGAAVTAASGLKVELWGGLASDALVFVGASTGWSTAAGQFAPSNIILPSSNPAMPGGGATGATSTDAYNYFFQVRVYAGANANQAEADVAALLAGATYGESIVFKSRASSTAAYNTILNTGTPSFSTWVNGITPVGTGFGAIGVTVVPVPEPTSFALAGLGAAALLIFRRRN